MRAESEQERRRTKEEENRTLGTYLLVITARVQYTVYRRTLKKNDVPLVLIELIPKRGTKKNITMAPSSSLLV